MTNDNSTPSAKRIMRPLPMTEKNTVERAIEIEVRMEEIERQLSYYDHLIFEAGLFNEYPHWIDDKYDDLESELSDLQKEYRG